MSFPVVELPAFMLDPVLLLFRVFGFGLLAGSIFFRIISPAVFLALLSGLYMFAFPLVSPEFPSVAEVLFIETHGASRESLFATDIICQVGSGLILGLTAGSVFAVASLFSRWASSLLLPYEDQEKTSCILPVENCLLVLAIISVLPWASLAGEFFLHSFSDFPMHVQEFEVSVVAWKMVLAIGRMALSLSLLLLLPVFIAFLISFIALIVLERLFPNLKLDRIVLFPVVLLFLAYGLNRYSLFEEESWRALTSYEKQRVIAEEVKSLGK